ncbi:YchJ family protein [Paraburkholderia megapolitana]|uniref:YchJ family protein n=1 Tax=Paraburkholderia megapolitana TaxID=420953 RepID=UPI0038B83A21
MVSFSPPTSRPSACPCGGAAPGSRSGTAAPPFAQCCGRFIDGDATAPDALTLMRSRYSAYVLGATQYLRATWAPHTCPADLDASEASNASDATRWLGLQIKHFTPLDATHAEVEFVARYKIGGRAHRLHELSRFVRDDSGWRYVDGDIRED